MKYIKLFEDFPDFGPENIGGAEHTKSWMSSMKGIDENVMKLRELMDSIREGEQKMKQLTKRQKLMTSSFDRNFASIANIDMITTRRLRMLATE